jgi:hypothetical protein
MKRTIYNMLPWLCDFFFQVVFYKKDKREYYFLYSFGLLKIKIKNVKENI